MSVLLSLWFDCEKNIPQKTFNWVIYSMKRNPNIDFQILTNDKSKFEAAVAENITVYQYDRDKVIQTINSMFKSDIALNIPNKLFGQRQVCGLKPYIYKIFNDVIKFKEYTHVGWMDYDIILEENFDNIILDVAKDQNISYFARNGFVSQCAIMSQDFNNYIMNNKLNYLIDWYPKGASKSFRYFDEAFYSRTEDSTQIPGFLQIQKEYNKEYKKSVYKFKDEDSIMTIGGGKSNKPRYKFSIEYNPDTYVLNKDSIRPIEDIDDNLFSEYKELIKSKCVVWSLDMHFKLRNGLNQPLIFRNFKEGDKRYD